MKLKNRSVPLRPNEMNSNCIHIFIKVDDKHIIDTVVNTTDRILEVLKRIIKRSGIQGSNLRLMYNGLYLEDECSVEDSELINGSVVHLMNGLRGGMQIYIKNIEGKIYTIEVKGNDTVGDLKNKVYEKSGFPPKEQRLVYRGSCLMDDRTIDQVGLTSNSEVNLVIRQSDNIKVLCKVKDGREITANVQLTDTVEDLKVQICEQVNMKPVDIGVIFGKVLLEASKTLRDCNLTHECEVDVIVTKSTNLLIYLVGAIFIVLMAYELCRLFQ